MTKYIKKVAFFSLGLIVLNIATFFFASKPLLFDRYLIPNDSLRSYHNFLFGDSHGAVIEKNYLAEYGILNFSYGSDNYCDIYNKISFLYQVNASVDTILISVDDHTLSLYRENINNLNRSILYASRQTYQSYTGQGILSYYVHKYILPYLPIFNSSNSRLFSYYILEILLPEPKATNTSGAIGSVTREINLTESKERVKYQFPGGKESSKLESCLTSIIQLCKSKETVLIGVKFPLSRTYLQLLGDRSYNADKVFSQQGLPVIDLKHVFAKNDSMFKDPDHLNQKGAKEFSSILIQSLEIKE